MSFLTFLASLRLTDWLFIAVAWIAIAVALGMFTGKAMKHADEAEHHQPAVRRWRCSDGSYRSDAEVVDWAIVTPDAWARVDTDWDTNYLPGWVNDHDTVPDYVPSDWCA